MAMADHNADAANEIARREASEAAKRLAQTHAREAEIAILLEAGAKIIKRQEDEITGLMLELGQAQQDIADCSEQVLKIQADAAKVVHALDCSTQLIDALLAWLPEGLVLSEGVTSAHGAWRTAMKRITR